MNAKQRMLNAMNGQQGFILSADRSINMETPDEHIRWVANKDEIDVKKIIGTSDMKRIQDLKGNPLLLFIHSWAVQTVLDKNKDLELSEFGRW